MRLFRENSLLKYANVFLHNLRLKYRKIKIDIHNFREIYYTYIYDVSIYDVRFKNNLTHYKGTIIGTGTEINFIYLHV